MSNNLKKYTFLHLLAQQDNIRIPRIQRGYAQGRQTKKVEDIRKTFLHTLFQVIKGHRQSVELDFIYGSTRADAFEPLDGQQRLTTLFLIHWMLGVELTQKANNKRSVFTYASCPTSEEFSNALVMHDALGLIEEAFNDHNGETLPSDLIKKRDWFYWKWKFDPSISSMLVMIDSIFNEITDNNKDTEWREKVWVYRSNLDHITFNALNLGDFGLSNELFVKMNARGKQLSDFDKMKSTLEEEIQIQQHEYDGDGSPLADNRVEATWRTLMDGKWSDYFWHTYARPIIESSKDDNDVAFKAVCLNAAKKSETQFKKLLLRLIQFQLLSQNPQNEALREACYKRNSGEIENLLTVYSDSLLGARTIESRTVNSSEIMIDFAAIIQWINTLIITGEDGSCKDIFCEQPQRAHFRDDDVNLMQSFLEDNVANDVALTFYSSMLFACVYPYEDNESWKTNFNRWVVSLRNILSNENNTQRIDKRWRYEKAITAIQEMMGDMVSFGQENNSNPSLDYLFVCRFFVSLGNKTYVGIDNQSLKEECDKASLILSDKEWAELIQNAESEKYLWGQIRALIQWAQGELAKFKQYSDKLVALLDLLRRNQNKYYLTALKFEPAYWKDNNRLYQLSNHRDNSFKRYLRDFDDNSSMTAPLIKRILDKWNEDDRFETIDDFFDSIIESDQYLAPTWVDCIIRQPSILDFAYYKRPFLDKGHVVLAELKTQDSHCIDPILLYLHKVGCLNQKGDKMGLSDSKGTPRHSLVYHSPNGTYTLQWDTQDSLYQMIDPDESSVSLHDFEAVEKFSHLLIEN